MYNNRGSIPDIELNNEDGEVGEGGNGDYFFPMHYWFRPRIVLKYDKSFVAMEIFMASIIILAIFAVYVFGYQVSFNDPIATIKSNFLIVQLISIIVSIVSTVLVTFFSKSKENLIRNLILVSIASILVIFVLMGIKMNLDNKYNEVVFSEFYEIYEYSENDKHSIHVNVGVSGLKMGDAREIYIEKSKEAYNNFKVRTTLYMILHILTVFVIVYLSYRIITNERKKEQLEKMDAILYDDD